MSNASISYICDVTTTIQTAIAADESAFTRCLFLDDDSEIPLDTRYLQVTKSDYTDYFTSGTEVYNFCSIFFGQPNTPQDLMVGRLILAATSHNYILPSYNASNLVAGPTTAGFTLDDGTNADVVDNINLSGTTTMAEVAAAIQAEIRSQAILITGYATITVTVDNQDRLIISDPNQTGSSAVLYGISAGGTTDISGADYLNGAAAIRVPGYDIG